MKKYIHILILVIITTNLYAQLSEERRASSPPFVLEFLFKDFDACTIGSGATAVFKIEYTQLATPECSILEENFNPPDNDLLFSLEAETGSSISYYWSFVLFPPGSSNCYGSSVSCGTSIPHCCFTFDCCDCGQWENSVLEGMWYISSPVILPPLPSTTGLVEIHIDVPTAFYPVTPNTNSNNLDGCNCCTY